MAHAWPSETAFRRVDLDVENRVCGVCEGPLHVCAHRERRIFTLQGPWRLVVRLVHCPDRGCLGHGRTISSPEEMRVALPRLVVGWDVFAWIGHRRFARHWSVPQIRAELRDTYDIDLSEDAIEKYLRRYEVIVAARQMDEEQLRAAYADAESLILAIDGLQPEKGHETLYVVRELTQRRVWFAEPLLSSSNEEVRRLFVRAREMAESLVKPVTGWMSDKQEAFVQGIAEVFPGAAHGYCQNHFVRDLAKPVLEQDSHAKVQMRSKVRGLRAIERAVLRERVEASISSENGENLATAPLVAVAAGAAAAGSPLLPGVADSGSASSRVAARADGEDADGERRNDVSLVAGDVVLEYCAAVRGILNDDQGGPLHPPGLRMAEALQEVRRSLQRNLAAKKGGRRRTACGV